LAGFKFTGIVLNSLAALIQSKIGIIAPGSIFAKMQSLGASGTYYVMGVYGVIGVTIIGISFGGYKLYVWLYQ
jgi:hypothetical protein